jgi:hypothetical protein
MMLIKTWGVTGGLKHPSRKIGALGVVVSGCRAQMSEKSGGRPVQLEYSITTNTQQFRVLVENKVH